MYIVHIFAEFDIFIVHGDILQAIRNSITPFRKT